MKIITLIFLIAFCGTANANWFPVGKQNAKTVYTQKSDCEATEGHTCLDISDKDLRFHELQTVQVDDPTKPIWKTHYDVETCSDASDDCQTIALAKTCTDEPGDLAMTVANELLPGFKVVCTRLTGYEQKDIQQLVLNEATQATVLAEDLVKQQTNSAIAEVKKKMECGKTVQATMALRNVTKGLTAAQVKTFTETFATIKSLLDAGALVTAKAEVEAITPDGTLTTAADKTAIIQQIDICLQ